MSSDSKTEKEVCRKEEDLEAENEKMLLELFPEQEISCRVKATRRLTRVS